MTQNQPSSVISKAPGTIVQVAVPLPIRRATPLIYDYHLPDGLTAEIGMIVGCHWASVLYGALLWI